MATNAAPAPRPASRRRPGNRPTALGVLGSVLAQLADVGDAADEIDAEIAAWATAMLRDGESAGSTGAAAQRITPKAEANG